MALSILAAIAPLLFKGDVLWKYVLAVALGTILVCTTYQASSGIFPMAVILLVLRMWNQREDGKKIRHFLFSSVVGYGIGIVFFKLIIMVPTGSYVSNALPPLSKLLPTLVTNYKGYFSLLQSDFKALWKWLILLLLLVFVISQVKTSKQKRLFSLFSTIIAGALMFLLCFGLYPALSTPLYEPRAMYGFGIFLTLLGISTAESIQPTTIKLPAMVVSWIFFTFSFTYGNALYVQKTYTDFRITQVISDLNDMECFSQGNPITVQIGGTIGYAPAVRRMNSEYNILTRLVPVTFREWWTWGLAGFYDYYDLKNVKQDDSVDLTTYNLPMVKDTMYHVIYSDGNNVLIWLKSAE